MGNGGNEEAGSIGEAEAGGGRAGGGRAGGATAGDGTTSRESLWGFVSPGESRWPATVTVLVALALQIALPHRLTPGPRLLLPALELVLLVPLVVANPSRLTRESRDLRVLALGVIAVITAANLVSLALLIQRLLGGTKANGRQLILAGVSIWTTVVLIFAVWYWEVDRGGPVRRCSPDHGAPDFLFPQMENPGVAAEGWAPTFVDYLYVSLTNTLAFSPTDTMPLTGRVKLLMSVQSLASLTTIAIVGARAVNILS
ncbi:MAG: hypothetical protein ACYDAD_06970 [Acidimicrobiales bacterium]